MPLGVRIALLRRLARHAPLRYDPRLAEALVTRSQQVSIRPTFTARRTAAAEEAVELYRRLESDHPGRHRVGLARALIAQAAVPDDRTLATAIAQGREAISNVEDTDDREALVVLAEARRLVAASLHSIGSAREALRLALRARATWLSCRPVGVAERMGLARTLIVIGDCRAALGRPEEALAAHQEAMDLYRALPLLGQSRWAPTGQAAAAGLADSLAVVGRWEDALAVAEEFRGELESRVWLRLQPRQARLLLHRLLRVVAHCQEALGKPEAALRTAEKAVAHQRRLVLAAPAAYGAGLGDPLHTLGMLLARAGRRDEAADRLAEAVDVARGVDDDLLARVMLDLANLHVAGGGKAAAEALLAEAVPLCRTYAEQLPEVWRPRLACALALTCMLSAFPPPPGAVAWAAAEPDGQAASDNAANALTAGREAVELARKLAGADGRYFDLLAGCLFGLERAVNGAGDPLGASELLRECASIRRDLFRNDPVKHRLGLAEALGNLGNRLKVLDRLDEAVEAHRECVALLRDGGPDIPPGQLLRPLRNLEITLERLGHHDEAGRIADEIARIEQHTE
ncbi:tetratricopeptide repeat protein [Micromonospora sp. NPDC048999]|uniref:tetratricopeptide repeat protein n=1 Tax=Micromonospora sp. NPDC048999 TaxID=3155391 RepID=UPI0033C36CBF